MNRRNKEHYNLKLPDDAQVTNTIISSNIQQLIAQNKMTQKEFAKKMKIAPSTVSDYCKGTRIPNVEFFITLKNFFDISIDDFLTKSINPAATAFTNKKNLMDQGLLIAYGKYCGMYYVYYFDTSKYKGKNDQNPEEALQYGIVYIYLNPSSLDLPEYSCAAVLGIKDMEKAVFIRKTLESLEKPSKIIDYIEKNYPATAYFGDFELTRDHAFLSISHENTDKALIILHRVDNNKPNYSGGIGTINSVCKGRERMPVIQFLGLSRHRLKMSVEEIHHCLLLHYPTFHAKSETNEMIQTFKTLYMEDNESNKTFSEYHKTIFIRSILERQIKKNLERNMFRYAKISGRDDDSWYHAIKADASTQDKEVHS